jgi:glycosyltransferase involved in cell wall biosynthesis
MDLLYIIIPFYNAAATLERTVLSLDVLGAGSRRRTRVIGVDDGSGDESSSLFETTASRIKDLEYSVVRKTNGGSGSARNTALKSIDKGWIFFLDADDELVFDPFPLLDQNPGKSALLFSVTWYKNRKVLKIFRPDALRRESVPGVFSSRNPLTLSSIIFRREKMTNLFDEELLYLEDWHFWAVNPAFFENCGWYSDVVLGRVHISGRGKTADQQHNGIFRVKAAEKIMDYWGEKLGEKELNNLLIQMEIGRMQMGKREGHRVFFRVPSSLSLYMKLIIYRFFFGLYARFGPYAAK